MKTFKTALIGLLFVGIASLATAQDKPAAATKKDGAATTKTDKKSTDKKSTDTKASSTSGQHLKKDGTPDMRYKENKQAAGDKKAAAPAKDGGKDTKSAPAKGGKGGKKATTTPATK